MRRFIVGLSAGAVLLTAVAVQAEIIIGVNVSSTGPAASLGIPAKNIITGFGPSMIAGEKVRYVIYDDASDSTTAVQNVKRLTAEDKVDVIIGPTNSVTSLAVINPASEAKTPCISTASMKTIAYPVDEKKRWMFKLGANDETFNSMIVNHMAKSGIKTASIIATDDSFGEINIQVFNKLAMAKGIKTLATEKYLRTDTSTTSQVLHVMKGNPDAVYIVAVGTPAATPHRALIERGYKGKIYQTGAVASADFLRVGGKAVEGSFFPQSPVVVAEQLPDGYPTKLLALKFITEYEAKFGPRTVFAAVAWDALKILEAAIPTALKSAKPGTEKFREALRTAIENLRGFKAATAVFTMSPTDHTGVDQLGMSLIKIENGAWTLVDSTPFK